MLDLKTLNMCILVPLRRTPSVAGAEPRSIPEKLFCSLGSKRPKTSGERSKWSWDIMAHFAVIKTPASTIQAPHPVAPIAGKTRNWRTLNCMLIYPFLNLNTLGLHSEQQHSAVLRIHSQQSQMSLAKSGLSVERVSFSSILRHSGLAHFPLQRLHVHCGILLKKFTH